MVLASSLAFASEKGELCQSSFNTPKNPELKTVTNKTEDIRKESIADTYNSDKGNLGSSQNLYPLVNQAKDTSQLNAQRADISRTEKDFPSLTERAFPPLLHVNGKFMMIIKDPATKKDVQERMWDFALNKSQNRGIYDIINKLNDFIKNGADIYAKDEKGWTLLDHAVFSGNPVLVFALIHQSNRTTREGYRSFINKVVGFGVIPIASGYSVSDYKRALRIARENKGEELFEYTLHSGEVVTLSRPKNNEEQIIEYLKTQLSYERVGRANFSMLLFLSGLLGLYIHSFISWIFF